MHILQATNLYPLASNLFIISPTSPLWTPSGLIMMKVRSAFLSAIFANVARMLSKVATMWYTRLNGKGRPIHKVYDVTLFGENPSCLFCGSFLQSGILSINVYVYYTNIDQILVNLLHILLNCEIGGLDCDIMKTEYRTRVHCLHMYHLFYNALVHVIYLGVSGQCSHTI